MPEFGAFGWLDVTVFFILFWGSHEKEHEISTAAGADVLPCALARVNQKCEVGVWIGQISWVDRAIWDAVRRQWRQATS